MSKKFIKSTVIVFSFLILSLFIPKISFAAFVQQGSKLVVTGAIGNPALGSISISSDGNTAIVGGFNDNSNAGVRLGYSLVLMVFGHNKVPSL